MYLKKTYALLIMMIVYDYIHMQSKLGLIEQKYTYKLKKLQEVMEIYEVQLKVA